MSLDVIAVDFDPVKWVVWCSICDSSLTIPTENSELVDALEADLEKNHLHD